MSECVMSDFTAPLLIFYLVDGIVDTIIYTFCSVVNEVVRVDVDHN